MSRAWRRWAGGGGAALGALLWGGAALAGVENTHHDLRLFNLQEGQGVCTYCHVTHRAASEESLLAREGTQAGALGRVGAFCYTCHDGTVVPTALIEAPDGAVGLDALSRSHGLVIANLSAKTGGLETAASVLASGLVPLDRVTGALPERMECTACHDPHSAANPPFLRAPLAELCQRCHRGANGLGAGRHTSVKDAGPLNGAHPVGMPVVFSGNDRARPSQAAPEMVFSDVFYTLRVPGLSEQGLADPAAHWTTGGHLAGFGTDPRLGQVMCSTCHSAHSTRSRLLVLPAYDVALNTDPLCIACHGSSLRPENPGGTPYYHPVHAESLPPYATTAAPQRPLKIQLPAAWPVGEKGALLCGTCHRAHQGRSGTKGLRSEPTKKRFACDACHLPDEDVVGPNSHHLTSATDRSALLKGRLLSWYRVSGDPGDLADGMTCIDCHVDLAKSAHNW